MNARFLLAPVALLCAAVTVGSAVSAAAAPYEARTARVSFSGVNCSQYR